MSLKDFKVLTFDVVGTLIDFEGGMIAYLRAAVPDSRVTDDDFLAPTGGRAPTATRSGIPTTWNAAGTPSRRSWACPTAMRLRAACAIRSRNGRHSPTRCKR